MTLKNYCFQNQFFNHTEGYIKNDNGVYNYVYQYKDHLGNIRLSYQDMNNNGAVDSSEIKEENNYYPFGLEHKGYNNVVNGSENNYQTFQGQELEEELGKNTIAYQWRDYDPAIGRFNKIDRFAEKYYEESPYHFSKNNPIYFREIKGDSINVNQLLYKDDKINVEGMYVLFNMISDLQDITGTSISINGNGNLIANDLKGKDGNQGGSEKARTYLQALISDEKFIRVSNDNDDARDTFGGGIGTVNLNSNQIDGNIQAVQNAGLDELTYGYGMSFLHETLHTATGTFIYDPNAIQVFRDPPNSPGPRGATVNKVNEYRSQLGLPTRSEYFWNQTQGSSAAPTMLWRVNGTNVNVSKTEMSKFNKTLRRSLTPHHL